MEFTVEFNRYHMDTGKEVLLETTMCANDNTKLKREVTKLSKTIKPFGVLQAEYPQPWHSYGYAKNESFSKKWSEYTQGCPPTDGYIYNIHVTPTANGLNAASHKTYEAYRKLKDAQEELQRRHANDTDLSKIDPELATIIEKSLPDHINALIGIFDTVEKRINEKIKELNEKME